MPKPSTRILPALRLFSSALLALSAATSAQALSPGAQDTTFASGTSANGGFYALALQGNGQGIVGGKFSTFRGVSRNAIARLNTDGSLDGFDPGLALSTTDGSAPTVRALAIQADGKILAAGSFNVLGQSAGGGVVRLNPDGSLDSTFNVGSGVIDDGGVVGTAYTLKVLSSGQILVGGAFVTFNGVNTAGLVRLNSNGSVDATFNPAGTGVAANTYGQDVRSITLMDDGRTVIGGHFNAYDGHAAHSVARLNVDGTLDTSFNAGEGVDDGGVNAVAVQADGKVLVGGGYNHFDGISTNHLVRLNTDGSLDTSYNPNGSLFVSEIDALLVQPDSSALVGGSLLSQGGLINSPHDGLARFLSNGAQDSTFDSGSNSRQVTALALQPDGKALVASTPSQLVGSATGDVFRHYDSPSFFTGEHSLSNNVFYLDFPDGNFFGYYTFLTDPNFIYHFDLGYEYVFDDYASDHGVYFYDFQSGSFFFTSPSFGFPYLYDFSLNTVLYYYPDPSDAGRYNTNGVRYFYRFDTGQIITK